MPSPAEMQQLMGVCMALLDRFMQGAGGYVQMSDADVREAVGKVDARLVDGTWHVRRIPPPPKSSLVAASANALDRLNGNKL